MRMFYSFENFDFNYVADATVFTKADAVLTNTNQVVVTQAGQRHRQSVRNL